MSTACTNSGFMDSPASSNKVHTPRLGEPVLVDSLGETRKDMDEVIRLSHESVLEQKCTSNTTSPISKLPVETLQEIFLLLAWSEDPEEENGYTISGTKFTWEWLTVTKICQDWRRIAISRPLLWTRLSPLWCENRLRTYLERSQSMDLHIEISHADVAKVKSLSSFYQAISMESGRIRSIIIQSPISRRDWKSMRSMLTAKPMLRLRSLELTSSEYQVLLDKYRDKLSSFFAGVRLDRLSLCAISIPWNHHMLEGLKELVLINIRSAVQPTFAEFLSILEGCPEMRHLELSGAGPTFSNSGARVSRTITLPQLRNISVHGLDFRNCEEFFNSLVMSPKTAIYFGCVNYPFLSPQPFPLAQLDNHYQCNMAEIALSDHSISFSTPGAAQNRSIPPLELSLRFADFQNIMGSVFRCILPIFNQPFWGYVTFVDLDLRFIGMSGEIPARQLMSSAAWASLLDQLHAIRHLRLFFSQPNSSRSVENFIESLTQTNSTPIFDFRCPKLLTLVLYEASFRETTVGNTVNHLTVLANHLFIRHHSSGTKLRSLSLIRCEGVSKDQYSALKEVDFCDELYVEWLGDASR